METTTTAQPRPRSLQAALPYLALLTGILALSLSSMFVRWSAAHGTVTSFYRMAIAALVLTPVFLRNEKTRELRKHSWWFALPLLGGLFMGLDQTLFSTSLGLTRIANVTLLNNIAPLWVALFAAIVWKERLRGLFWIGLALALAGAATVFGNDLLSNPHLSFGDMLSLVSSLFYTGYFLTTQFSRRKLDTMPYLWGSMVMAALVLLAVNLGYGRQMWGFPPQTYLIFVAAGLISQLLGYFALVYALGRLPAAVVAPSMVAQPVLTALLAIPLAGEALEPAQWIGGILTLAGIFIVNKVQG